MELTDQYCPTRNILEERVLNLVTRLANLTSRLMLLVGKNHQAFISTKADCCEARSDIIKSRQQLQAHRSKHGC
jgi:hypothetical protein